MTKRKIFAADGEFKICAIADEDRSDYVELHRQLNGEKSLYLNPLSKDMMWEQILSNADSVFSLFTTNGDYCGSIELQQSDSNTPEIGIDLLESKRNQGIAPNAVRLFAKKVYEIRLVDYFFVSYFFQVICIASIYLEKWELYMNKTYSMSIRASEEELNKFKKTAKLEAYASYIEFVRRTALKEAERAIIKYKEDC